MLKLIRIILIVIFSILICIGGTIYSLIFFRNPNNTRVVSRMFAKMHKIVGLEVEYRFAKQPYKDPAIYIANHQNNYDMLTISHMVPHKTVSIGKKSLIWIPFFGIIYWITGNILIDRDNKSKSHATMNKVSNKINNDKISIWMFPEGTRSRGRGLLPFKTGAFHTAIAAGVPIIPIICSNTNNKIDLNRWNNGKVICKVLEPIPTDGLKREDIRKITKQSHQIMQQAINELDQEILAYEQNRKK